jgi:hypothetical protein
MPAKRKLLHARGPTEHSRAQQERTRRWTGVGGWAQAALQRVQSAERSGGRRTVISRPVWKAEGHRSGFIWMATGSVRLESVAQAKRVGPKNVVTAGGRGRRRRRRQ